MSPSRSRVNKPLKEQQLQNYGTISVDVILDL